MKAAGTSPLQMQAASPVDPGLVACVRIGYMILVSLLAIHGDPAPLSSLTLIVSHNLYLRTLALFAQVPECIPNTCQVLSPCCTPSPDLLNYPES